MFIVENKIRGMTRCLATRYTVVLVPRKASSDEVRRQLRTFAARRLLSFGMPSGQQPRLFVVARFAYQETTTSKRRRTHLP